MQENQAQGIAPNDNIIPSTSQNVSTGMPTSIGPKTKGRKLRRKMFLFGILFILLVIFFLNIAINSRREVIQENPGFVKETTQSTKSQVPVEPERKWSVLELNEFGLKISYLQNLYIERSNPFSNNPPSFSVLYRGSRQPEGLINEANLTDGYIFKAVIYANPVNTNIKELAKKKLDTYVFNCPEITSVSTISSSVLDNLPSATFSVTNCLSDFKETYVLSGNFVYEFVQIFKGDLGYKQKYEEDTDEMLASVKIDRAAPAPESMFTVFNSESAGIMFTHPKLNTTCCRVPRPSNTSYSNEWYFADINGAAPDKGKPFDGFGLFIYKLKKDETVESYLISQEVYLKEDYKLSTGHYADDSSIEDIKVGNTTGKLFKNYAWWGDIIYVSFNSGRSVAVISKTEFLPGSFKELFEGILATFAFNVL
jgi:hypothetical protein